MIEESLSFDDVLLIPKKSDILPSEVNLKSHFTKNISLNLPISSAAMDTVTLAPMAIAMALSGGIGVIHRNISADEQIINIKKVKDYKFKNDQYLNASIDSNGSLITAVAIGAGENEFIRAQKILNESDIDVLVVDTSHGHSTRVIETLKKIKSYIISNNFKAEVISGNIVTSEAASDLIDSGSDALKVGIGPGSICTTRIVAGIGIPQLTSIINVVEKAQKYNIPVIADGGIKNSGDIVKALAAGASSVMLGSLLSGTDETPGDIILKDNVKYKEYRGMGSAEAMKLGSAERYRQKSDSKKLIEEGISSFVLYKGSVFNILANLEGSIKIGFGYIGAKNIQEAQKDSKFIRITTGGLFESYPHIRR